MRRPAPPCAARHRCALLAPPAPPAPRDLAGRSRRDALAPDADPVVASDGHPYERAAIEAVLQGGNGLSPLTREPLRADVLIPNRALKRRIDEHEEDVLRMAATVAETTAANVLDRGAHGGGGGESSSSEPAPKRSRRSQ